jgi:hypothetical protein
MPVPQLNLDDRTFDQLAAEARALIPKYFPTWTDYNPSDPGITLLELFAFLMEAVIYQINRVPERSLERFAALVGVKRSAGEPIGSVMRRALQVLDFKYRAVTESEFEALALQADPTHTARAKVVVAGGGAQLQIINVAVVPNIPGDPAPVPSDALRERIFEYLRPRRLIGTRVRVVAPDYNPPVRIGVTVVRNGARMDRNTVGQSVSQAIRDFMSPISGGVDGAGWPFGRPVFRSELYRVIEGLAGVDHVRQLLLNGDENIGEIGLASALSLANLSQLSVTLTDS